MAGEFVALQAKFSRVQEALGPAGLKAALNHVGSEAKKDLAKEANDALGDAKFSGWKRMPKLTSGYDIDGTVVTMNPRPAGGWAVAESGRKRTSAPKRRARAILATPWGPRTYTKAHPLAIGAARGQHALTKATDVIQRKSPERLDDSIQQQLKAIF